MLLLAPALALSLVLSPQDDPPLSDASQECADCHSVVHPGIVADWRKSRHAHVTPKDALAKPELERRISAGNVPEHRLAVAVGCYECHAAHTEDRPDRFEHFGYAIQTIPSPKDCAVCHPAERDQYAHSKMGNAHGNLRDNPLYTLLVETSLGTQSLVDDTLNGHAATRTTENEACYGCHGTRIEVDGMRTVATDAGDIEVPNLTNWPNHGVGRINPDGSKGSCTSCHPRHSFSIEVARQPYTCGQCHLEPDVPAFNVYKESKHGNLFSTAGKHWDFDAVPWHVGRDFQAPTCATCHASLLVTPEDDLIAERTHDFGSRLWVRLFGLPYAHPQPVHGDTTSLRNADEKPLPTTFAGVPAAKGLIDAQEALTRRRAMERTCQACHGTSYAGSFFDKLEATVAETNTMTETTTQLMQRAWSAGLADPANPFDEPIERTWIESWLFYANSIRYASAMSGPDYAGFKNGWWKLSQVPRRMQELTRMLSALKR